MKTIYTDFALSVDQTILGRRCFRTVQKRELTETLREVTGRRNAKIGSVMALELEAALTEVGISTWPNLSDIEPAGFVRLYRPGTLLGRHIGEILSPSVLGDASLAGLLRSIKGARAVATTSVLPCCAAGAPS